MTDFVAENMGDVVAVRMRVEMHAGQQRDHCVPRGERKREKASEHHDIQVGCVLARTNLFARISLALQ